MRLDEVWLWYAAQRLGREPDPDDSEVLTPEEVQALLWDFNTLFEGRTADIDDAVPTRDADDGADAALCALAVNDNFDHWHALSAPVLRVLRDRHANVLVVAEVNRREGTQFMSRIPRGLDPTSRARTVWLQLMLFGSDKAHD